MPDTYLVEGRDAKRIEYSGTIEASSKAEAISKAKMDYRKSQGGGDPAKLHWNVTTSDKEETRIHHQSKRKKIQEH
jgi:hypothetical protein